MKIEEIVKDLDPLTLLEFKNYLLENLTELIGAKNSSSKIIANSQKGIRYCNECGCILYKNGKTKTGIQKYICSGCKHTTSETTGTITYCSKLSFNIWQIIIDNLLNGFSIRRIAEENNISVLTSFKLRHKVLLALDNFIDNIKLSKSAQSDEKYFKINLKGTKPQNMPRYSNKYPPA